MRKKALSWILVMVMLLSLVTVLPITASAEESYDAEINVVDGTGTGTGWTFASGEIWINEGGSYLISGSGIQTANRVRVKTGVTASVTLDNVNINVNLPFEVGGNSNVTMILKDGSANVFRSWGGHAGIRVQPAATLTITAAGQSLSDGALSAYGDADGSSHWASAGIGGSEQEPSGTIVIDGGTIFAKGGNGRPAGTWTGPGAAGIGGAMGQACGDITINGGTVTAIGGDVRPEGAGIGGGSSDPSTYGGKITINGGTIRAYSGQAGESGTGIGFCASIAIADTADVQAYSSGNYPAIYGITSESGHSVYLQNFMLDARVPFDTDMVITQIDHSAETFEMTLLANYKNFATTVGTSNDYTASLSDGSKIIVSLLDESTAFPGILDSPGTALSSVSVKLLENDTVAPILTAGPVYRTSATEATVRFVSDTAGTYYYQVTNSSTSPTVDDLSGWTSGGSVSADTITAVSPVGLTTGAKYVHIVVEDAAENLSDTLTFSMPYDIYFFDAFETYPENTTASSGLLSFTQAHNGNGDSNQKVVAEGTNQVFSLSGQSNWASDQYIALPNNLTGIIVLEAKTKPVSGTDPAYLRLFNGSQDTATVLVRDGYWHSRAAGTNTSLGVAYTTDTWYAVKLAYDTAANTFDIWIDGVKANTAPITGSLSTNYNLYLTAGNGSATTACFDDVRLYVTSTLDSDTTAPVLTAGSVSRTTDTSATVKFTSDEAGEYYYQVVASGDSAPTIDTTGDGIPCDTEEQTISLTGLTAGAKDIYIVVKDAADNVSSDSFKISIPTCGNSDNNAFVWVVYSNGSATPEGPAKLSLPDGQLTSILSDSSLWMSGAEFIGDQLYGVRGDSATSSLYTINEQTGACYLVGNTGVLFTGFTYDTLKQIAYASDPYNLYTVNLETGASTAVGAFSAQNTYMVIGIAADNDGNLFGLDIQNSVFLSIDPETAEATEIGPIGINVNYAQDIAYDRDNNILYGTLYNTSTSKGELYSLNTTTGTASFIRNLGAEIDGFAIPYAYTPHTDTTAPVLTAGSISRTADTSATVKFTSDEVGQYYFEVVPSGAPVPTIDATGTGTPCDSSEQTISLTGLTAGAKDIYIVVKDAAGNVSNSNFKISIPAYVPAAHGSIQFESGSWSVPEDYSSYGYVERVGGSEGIVTINYYTVNDTAVAGTHYAAQSGTLTWADGDSAPKTIPCTIYNDSTYNGYLQFSYVLSNPTGGAVLGSQDTLLMQIRDNDNPPIPSGLTATAGNGKVTLNWNEVKDAYYRVYFSTTSASYNEADSVDVYDETSTVITGLKNGTKYYFVVKAVHDIYLSPGSNEVSATPTSGNGGGSSISPDTGSQITISTTDDSTSVTGILTRVNGGTQIDIKNRAFDKLDAADKPVSINARIATVTFDKKAMDAIGTESGDEDVTVTARQVPASELSRRDRALVGSRPVYDFTVTGGGSTISSFGGGYATVNIPYTLLPGENPHAVVIWYLSDSGTLESVRGCYDAATKTVTFVTPHFSRFVIGYNLVAFSDITSSAWYYDAVTFLAARGVTTGTTAATFSPDDTLTRGQFIVMLLRAYGIESDSTAAHNFSDSGNTYYTGYLAAAKRLGITNGVGNNRFAPEQSITRQEMFTLLYNALRVIGAPPASTAGRTLTDFSDASAIAPWAKDAMTLLVESGTISGSGGKLNPTGITTRGEMAQVLYNLLSK